MCFHLFTDLDPPLDGEYSRGELKRGKRIQPVLPIQNGFQIDYYRHNGYVVGLKGWIIIQKMNLDTYITWSQVDMSLLCLQLREIRQMNRRDFFCDALAIISRSIILKIMDIKNKSLKFRTI